MLRFTEPMEGVTVTSGESGGRCVILVPPHAPGTAALVQAIAAAEVEVDEVVHRWPALLTAVAEVDADAAVVDLALAGRAGVRLIAAIRALRPDCRVVVLSELHALDLLALEAGAVAVVDPRDLRPVTAALRRHLGVSVHS